MMLKKTIAVAVLALLPSLASAEDFSVAELVQGITDPHIVGGVSYNNDLVGQKWQALLTANILGPKLGPLPCYALGFGVSLGTVAPGLEDQPIAAWSVPLLTCAPFGEQVVVQAGTATPLNGEGVGGRSYYIGLGISVSGGPNQLRAKRIQRIQAKQAAAKKKAEAAGPAPAATAGS